LRQKHTPNWWRSIAGFSPKEKNFEKVGVCDSPIYATQVAFAIEKVGQELAIRKWRYLPRCVLGRSTGQQLPIRCNWHN
jgi:hypothetical protein